MRGCDGFAHVTGILTCPTLQPDGSIWIKQGFDPTTNLWCWPDRQLKDYRIHRITGVNYSADEDST